MNSLVRQRRERLTWFDCKTLLTISLLSVLNKVSLNASVNNEFHFLQDTRQYQLLVERHFEQPTWLILVTITCTKLRIARCALHKNNNLTKLFSFGNELENYKVFPTQGNALKQKISTLTSFPSCPYGTCRSADWSVFRLLNRLQQACRSLA